MLITNLYNGYREELETHLGRAGVKPLSMNPIVIGIVEGLYSILPIYRKIPKEFTDFSRSARIIARQNGVSAEHVLENLKDYVPDLFEVHDLPYKKAGKTNGATKEQNSIADDQPEKTDETKIKRDARYKHLPDNDDIRAWLIKFRDFEGRLPKGEDGRRHMPEKWMHASTLLPRLRDERGLTPKTLLEGEEILPLPSRDILRPWVMEFYEEEGRAPTRRDGFTHLPEGSPSWYRIVTGLGKTEIAKLLHVPKQKAESNEDKKDAKPAGKGQTPLPDNDTLTEWLIAYRDKEGHLPNKQSSYKHLPEGSMAWPTLLTRLREERELTPTKLLALRKGTSAETTGNNATEAASMAINVGEITIDPDASAFKSGKKAKPLPENNAIREWVIKFCDHEGRYPKDADKYKHMPEGWLSASSLLERLKTERGLTPSMLLADEEVLPLPSQDTIRPWAKEFFEKEGHTPTRYDAFKHLPEGAPSWYRIVTGLGKAAVDNLLDEPKDNTGKPRERYARKQLPDRETITQWIISFYEKKGKLPNGTYGNLHLPEGSATWGALLPRIKKEFGLTPGMILKAHKESQTLIIAPEPTEFHTCGVQARDVFSSAAFFIRQRKEIPTAKIYHHFIAHMRVGTLNRMFAANAVLGWEEFCPDQKKPPSCLNDFLVGTGLALFGRPPVPAKAPAIRLIERRFEA